MKHKLKTWPTYFWAVYSRVKNFEVRKFDREFKVGDKLILEEWDNETGEYTGRKCNRTIGYILEGGQFGIEPGYCVLGFEECIF